MVFLVVFGGFKCFLVVLSVFSGFLVDSPFLVILSSGVFFSKWFFKVLFLGGSIGF